MLLVSPAEPIKIKSLLERDFDKDDAMVSPMPEKYGVDFLWTNQGEWWGVQRKEIKDFVASLRDGRLAREIGQMKSLVMPTVLIEGKVRFTTDGKLVYNSWGQEITRAQWRGMLWALNHQGIYTHFSLDMTDTVLWIKQFKSWSSKEHHHSLVRRPGPVSPWGKPGNRDYQEHLLQGFQGVGPELAKKILDHFGRLPLKWDITVEELMEVEGIGKSKAKKMMEGL